MPYHNTLELSCYTAVVNDLGEFVIRLWVLVMPNTSVKTNLFFGTDFSIIR